MDEMQEGEMASLMTFTPQESHELQCPAMEALAEQVHYLALV